MRLAKKSMALLFALLLTLGTAVPAFAAGQVTLTLQVRIGSTSALINNEKQTIVKPYMQKGTTMVPLGVFQRAFGTISRLEGEDTVHVSYGAKTVTFKIGNKAAWVNGKKTVLSAAPIMKNGTLMVPLRPVTDMLEATVKFSSGTIVATLLSDTGVPGQTPKDDEEVQTTARVGNSYAGWSIDYPADAVAQAGEDEFSASLGDLDGTYMMQIRVWQEEADVPVSDMLAQLEQETISNGETIVDQQTFPNATLPYARMITKDLDGIYWEARRFYQDGYVYSAYLGDTLIEDYHDFEEWSDLLDSFRPSFATPGIQTEDLTSVKDGYVSAASYDYGVTLNVPATWTPTGSGQLEYEGEDGSFLSLHATTMAGSGAESLSEWHQFLQDRTDEIFLPDYAQPIQSETLQAAGVDARIEKLTYDLGGGNYYWNWLVLEQEGYFYVLRYSAPEGAYSEQTFKRIVASMDIDFEAVPSSFGKLGQISYLKDKTLNVTQSTSDFVFHVPAYWAAQVDANGLTDMSFFVPGGSFHVKSRSDANLEASAAESLRHYADLKLDDPTFVHQAPERTTFAGMPAIRIAYAGTSANPYQAEDIYFRYKNSTYWIHYQLDRGTATPQQLDGIERALKSFKFIQKKSS